MRESASAAAAGEHRAVAVLHAVAAGPRQVVREERVGVVLEGRVLAEQRVVPVRRCGGRRRRRARHRQRRRRGGGRPGSSAPAVESPAAIGAANVSSTPGPNSDGLSSRNCRLGAVNTSGFSVGNNCVATFHDVPAGRSKVTRAGPAIEASRPHQRRGHVDVRMGRVDAEIGAVDPVAEHAIAHPDGPVVAGDVPLVQVRPARRQRPPGPVGDDDVVDVLRELVKGVAARRGAAHADLQRPRRHLRKDHLHLHPPMLRLGERQAVLNRRVGPRAAAATVASNPINPKTATYPTRST